MSMPTEKIAAAATATCVGTESTFVNGGAASYEAFASTDSLDDVWSISGPPPVAASPEQSFGTDSGSESDVPITPDTFAANPDVAVPDLALDGPVPSECDITMACTRLTELKMEKRSTNPVVRLFTGVRMRMRA